MSSTVFTVSPSPATGNNRRIELAGMDLLLAVHINNVFVYPDEIKIDRFQDALSRTLSLWPLVAGRTVLENGDRYFIEMCDNSIPIAVVENNDLNEWPFNSDAVVELGNKVFLTLIDFVDAKKLFKNSSEDEPLVRFKLTHIVQSNEWALGVSWYHPLGDAEPCLRFCNTLSRFYQQLEPLPPMPIFERRIWQADDVKPSILPIPWQFQDAQPLDLSGATVMRQQADYTPVKIRFTGEQLATLRKLAGGDSITIQDAMTAYIIVTLNTHCYKDQSDRMMLHTITVTNVRGVADSIAPQGLVSNALFMMVSNDFPDPYSLSSVAKTIRQSIHQERDPEALAPAIAAVDQILRKNVKERKSANPELVPNELAVNSNYRYDWAGLFDFGYTDKCRFYTHWCGPLYLRVFRLNPEKQNNEWLPRDRHGADVSFRLEKELTEKFLDAVKQDTANNFQNLKL